MWRSEMRSTPRCRVRKGVRTTAKMKVLVESHAATALLSECRGERGTSWRMTSGSRRRTAGRSPCCGPRDPNGVGLVAGQTC